MKDDSQGGCPQCGRDLITSLFDASFELADAGERLCFALPARLCRHCQELFLEPGLLDALDLRAGHCTFAIESDQVLLTEIVAVA